MQSSDIQRNILDFFPRQKSDLQILDLYAGAGGLGSGFNSFFDVVDAVDIDANACQSYRFNHHKTNVHNIEVSKFITSLNRKDFDGICGVIGGPPCQDFSQINHTRNVQSMRASQLLFMTNIVKDLLPKFALIENVSSVPVEIKNQSIKILQNAGYHVVAKIVRALDYGSVQIRRRWILTAVKDKHIYPEPSYSNRTAKEILTGEKSELTMTEDVRTGLKNLKSGHWVALPGQNWKGFFIIDPNKPLPAIINCNKDKYVRPDRQEYLSFHEIALAQGFPWNYRFFGTNTSIGQQLANAVPVELARSFVHVLFQHFNKNI